MSSCSSCTSQSPAVQLLKQAMDPTPKQDKNSALAKPDNSGNDDKLNTDGDLGTQLNVST